MSYALIIAEKPNAAQKIAQALAEKKPGLVTTEDGVKYYEFAKGKKKFIVVPAVGHLFSLKDVSKGGWNYPVLEYEWKPTFEINKRAAFAKKYFENIKKIAGEADDFIVATDFDIEGSVIGYNVIRFICGRDDAKRMKFSTLTKQDLKESYEHVMKHLDFPQIESGLARHELDFLWGINTSRALTLAIKKAGKKLSFFLLSAGRVQTPMLYFLMKKEKEIRAFKPKPYWQIEAKVEINKELVVTPLHLEGKFWGKPSAQKAFEKARKAKKAKVVSIETKQYKQKPPVPFDLTTLQTEAYRFFGWSPRQTTNIAQTLYDGGYISYPRTSSQKLPPQIGYENILSSLSRIKTYKKLCGKLLSGELKPNEGKKKDPAHPAVYPTAEVPDVKKLAGQPRRLYDLIVRRFLAVFAPESKRESVKVIFDIGGEKFPTTGRRTIEKGWTEFYGKYAKVDEVIFPEMKKGDMFPVKRVILLDKETSPPPRFSQGSIVREMEKHMIGTKTTRAQILQTLYDREYVSGKSIEVTDLGMKVSAALAKYVPDIVSEDLTRKFEKEMEKIEKGKKKRGKVVEDAKKVIKKISNEFRSNEMKIGRELEKAVLSMKQKKSILGPCPNCGSDLKVLFSPRTKKRFVGCGGYPKCRTGFPLPLSGMISTIGKICDKCNTPMIQVWRKGRRPFRMCLDPKCETKKDWAKPGEKKVEKKEVAKKEPEKKVKRKAKKKAARKAKKKSTKRKKT